MEKSFHVLATNLQTICRSQPVGNQLNLNIELNIIFDSISYRLQPIRRLNRSLHSAASNAMLFAPVFLVQLCAYVHCEIMELRKLTFVPSFLASMNISLPTWFFFSISTLVPRLKSHVTRNILMKYNLRKMAYTCLLINLPYTDYVSLHGLVSPQIAISATLSAIHKIKSDLSNRL